MELNLINMKTAEKKYDVGVIIGRFQIHELHREHRNMIDEVISRHKKVIVFLGCSPALSTKRNPLDFTTRKVMMEEAYGNKISAILPLHDMKHDDRWSKQVDEKIREVFPLGSVVLYGSKDSFIPYYSGKFDTCELEPENYISATQIRDEISNEILKSRDFRAGVIYSTYNTFPYVHPTVDIAILNEDYTKILLGRKKHEDHFRFIGGFVDVTDESYEDAAKREISEETTGLEVGDLKYLCSQKVDDWRYKKEESRAIITHFYAAKKIFGVEKPNDDIFELKWFDVNELPNFKIVSEHKKMLDTLYNYINTLK
jgi:bifunctional NMN adenylyltransferase/nudix hydrolase